MKNIYFSLLTTFLLVKATAVFALVENGELTIWSTTPPGNNTVILNDSVINRTLGGTCTVDRAIMNVSNPTILPFIPSNPNGTAVLIYPGGAYTRVVYDVEGNDIARYFNQHGITAFVLKYRLPLDRFTNSQYVPMQDAQRAIRYIRKNAKTWNLDTAKIGIMGASAGGHIAASIIAEYNKKYYTGSDSVDKTNARPNFGILLYAVVSMETAITHVASRDSLIGKSPTQTLIDEFSADKHVSAQSPRTFIALAADDGSVSPQNSQKFEQALKTAGVACELKTYANGGHGGGICKASGTAFANWTSDVIAWMATQRLVKTLVVPDVYFITSDAAYDATAIQALKDDGNNVSVRLLSKIALNKALSDSFNASKLVIIGRSNTSSDVAVGKEFWNKLTCPLMLMSHHSGATDKLNWYNGSTLVHITTAGTIKGYAPKSLQTDPALSVVAFDSNDSTAWTTSPDDVIQLVNATSGSVLLQTSYQNKKVILFERFDPGKPFYEGTCDKPWGNRTFLPQGINTGNTINGFTFTNDGKKIWLAEVKKMQQLPVPNLILSSDATLKDLTVSDLSVTNFNANTTSYDVSLPSGTASVVIKAIPTYSCAKVGGTGTITLKTTGTTSDTIKVTSEDGKTTKSYILKMSITTGVSGNTARQAVKIQPNPAVSQFQLAVGDEWLGSEVSIINVIGQIVKKQTISENSSQIDVSDLQKGVYLVVVKNNSQSVSQRLLIK